ncbi:MAG: hypothetical protein Q8Q05_00125, partial [bacterium]|nr:hypothetical protein [bacterium]
MNLLGIFKPKLEPEAFYAYFNRMPNTISVGWKKDGEYLVGEVSYDDFSFVTQAKSAEEFVSQVNEGVVISNNVPRNYISALREARGYLPSSKVLEELKKAAPGSQGLWEVSREKRK